MTSILKYPQKVTNTLRSLIDQTKSSAPRIRRLTPGELGASYDTAWARKLPAQALRIALLETVSRSLINFLASPTAHGTESFDALEGPAIFAANHASHLDTTLVLTQLPRKFRRRCIVAAAADYFFDRQWKAALWALLLNVIPIEREKVGRKSADLAARLINDGYNLVIFPEGTRSRDGSIAKFRGGAAYLGIKCAVPVVPVFIEGTRAIWRAGKGSIHRGQASIHFGKPMNAYPDERSRDFNERIENAVRELAELANSDPNPGTSK